MDSLTAYSAIGDYSRNFLAKNLQLVHIQLLEKNLNRQLIDSYLAFQPRNSFQGLPPLKDDICVKWVEEMIRTGINIIALCSRSGIVGHTAIFPINEHKCEILIVVWPRFQNIGIGTELTQCCVEIASHLGFEKIWLPVDATNLRARHIYAKCGFEYVSLNQSRELDMVCDLSRYTVKTEGIKIESNRKHIPSPYFNLGNTVMPAQEQPLS
jgi:RimJ/RimL family protein N-acetyltransferase